MLLHLGRVILFGEALTWAWPPLGGAGGVLGAELLGEGVSGRLALDPIAALQGDRRARLQAGGGFPQLDPSTPLRFAQDDEAIVLVEVGAEDLPVARFQRLSGGAVFPEQDHAAVQAFHVQLAVGVDAFRPERGP